MTNTTEQYVNLLVTSLCTCLVGRVNAFDRMILNELLFQEIPNSTTWSSINLNVWAGWLVAPHTQHRTYPHEKLERVCVLLNSYISNGNQIIDLVATRFFFLNSYENSSHHSNMGPFHAHPMIEGLIFIYAIT